MCVYYLYNTIYIDVEYCIIINREVGAPGHGKYVVDGLNSRDKRVFKLAMANILNPRLIQDNQIFQVHADSWKWIMSSCKFIKRT